MSFVLAEPRTGIAVGEAVVFFNRELAKNLTIAATGRTTRVKMRYLSAPWVGVLQDGAWLRHAGHSNAMARRLESAIRKSRV